MATLTINPGSTSTKYVVFDDSEVVTDTHKFENLEGQKEWLSQLTDIERIGIRIVHAGDITKPTVLTNEIIERITASALFAPIHNPIALETISLIQEIFENVPIVGVFDTAFHINIPRHARTYPIPKKLAQQYDIRRYGFHGIALRSVLKQVISELKKEGKSLQNAILVHLGGGSSIAAIQDKVCIDTTMGLTPLEGIMMNTRSGTVDPDLPRILQTVTGKNAEEVSKILNTESGFFGLTGSTDVKRIIEKAKQRNAPEKLAFDMLVYQTVKQIFAYYGVLQKCDALVFSGGIGANNAYLRETIAQKVAIIIGREKVFTFKADEARELFETTLQKA